MKSKTFKVTVFLLLIIFITSSFSVTGFASFWNGKVSENAPAITNDGYYLISDGEDLAWFSENVNSKTNPNPSLKAKLTNDIYLNDDRTNFYWTPIGNYSDGKIFSGIFNGCGYTIYGLKISNTLSYQGLFGYISSAKISNVNISSSVINANSNIGGICGYSDCNSVITSCLVDCDITASGSNIGGISGYENDHTVISKCGFSGKIKNGTFRIGGITGASAVYSEVVQSFNTGSISSNGKYVGGIIGTSSAGTVECCYNTGTISGENYVAGIVGNNVGNIYCSYSASEIISPNVKSAISARNVQVDIQNCFYDKDLFPYSEENAVPKFSNDMKRHSFINVLNDSGGDFNYDYMLVNKNYPILGWQLDINLWSGSISKPALSKDGTYYIINNGEELAWFSGLVNGTLKDGTPQNTYANGMLMSSIILNIGEFDDNSNLWTPIGNVTEFNGQFDGNGFTVRGVYVDGENDVGLFGNISAIGSVTNLTIAESKYNGNENVGSLAGTNYGNISKIKCVFSEIKGNNNVGGIIGDNGGEIFYCSSVDSTVQGKIRVGGLIGVNSSGGSISTCCSSNNVNAQSYAGGLVGQCNSNISLSFNSGNITATGSYVGGITGVQFNSSSVTNCYNTGDISANSKVGGICGIIRENSVVQKCYNVGNISGNVDSAAVVGNLQSGNIINCYYDSTRISAIDKNATYKTTEQMTTALSITNLSGFERSVWTAKNDSDYFVYYPQITEFANSGDFDLADTSLNSVSYLKYGLKCKVTVGDDVSYHKSLNDASDYIGTGKGTISLFEDMDIKQTVTINGDVTIFSENENIILSRAIYLFGTPFSVNGTLTFGNSGRSAEKFVIKCGKLNDPANVKKTESFVTVNENGTFNMYNTEFYSGNALKGGFITNNSVVNLYSGEIRNCEATAYGGVVYNNGILNIYSVEIHDNNAKLCGGVISNGTDGITNINTGANIHGNLSGDGGAIYIEDGEVNIIGGTVNNNSSSNGGAIYVDGGQLNLYDGTIYDNKATLFGNGVYNNSTVNFYSGGTVDLSNDLYLPENKYITMSEKSSYSVPIVLITPEKYDSNVKIVNGKYCAMNYKLCSVSENSGIVWHMNSSGHIVKNTLNDVAMVSNFGAYNVYYTSLEEALEDIGNETAVITLIDDVVLTKTLEIKGEITIYSDGDVHTISACEGFEGSMFIIKENGLLKLEKTLDDTGLENVDLVYIDGSNVINNCLILVENGGVLQMKDGIVLYGSNGIDSVAEVKGIFNMYGGSINGNITNKGAVYINKGEMNYFSGTLFDNTSSAIYVDGTLNLQNSSVIDKSNKVRLAENRKINFVNYTPASEKIIVLDFDKYNFGFCPVNFGESLSSQYNDKITLYDDSYYFDGDYCIRADGIKYIQDSGLLYDNKLNAYYGLNLDVNSCKNITDKFENKNAVIAAPDGRIKGDDERVGTNDRIALIDKNGDLYYTDNFLVYGDISGDGYANGSDYSYFVFRYYNMCDISSFNELQIEAMDVDHDGYFTYSDLLKIENTGLLLDDISQQKAG